MHLKELWGLPDIYPPEYRGYNASVNFITCHDGFTLYDLYSYNHKHNEGNGWNNTDGDNSPTSWNCGIEGETDDPDIMGLRIRMVKNAFAVLLCSRGAAMFPAGDEFCNTQFGNNNAYCQDNIISWLDWTRLDKFHEVFEFVKDLIAFRNRHPIIRKNTSVCSLGYPCMSVHNSFPHNQEFRDDTHVIGILFAGRNEADKDDLVFLAINAHWEQQNLQLPDIPNKTFWNVEFFTNALYESGKDNNSMVGHNDNTFFIPPRTVVIFHHEKTKIK